MKSPRISLRQTAVATVALTAAVLIALLTAHGRRPQPEAPTQQTTAPFQYVMQQSGGANRLALYMVRNGELVKVTEYDWAPEELPLEERAALARGLALRDAGELQRALEDYLNA